MHAPLKGVRVLDLSRLIPGPFCTLILSDLGATVDKLEDPHVGDYLRVFPPLKRGLSGRFNALNRDKRSLCLDLKKPEGRDALLRLARRYDVVVESFRPGVLDKLGVGYAALSREEPAADPAVDQRLRAERAAIATARGTTSTTSRSAACSAWPGRPIVRRRCRRSSSPTSPAARSSAPSASSRRCTSASAPARGQHVDVSMCEGALAFAHPRARQLRRLGRAAQARRRAAHRRRRVATGCTGPRTGASSRSARSSRSSGPRSTPAIGRARRHVRARRRTRTSSARVRGGDPGHPRARRRATSGSRSSSVTSASSRCCRPTSWRRIRSIARAACSSRSTASCRRARPSAAPKGTARRRRSAATARPSCTMPASATARSTGLRASGATK